MVGDVFAACDEMFMRAPRFFPSYRIAIAADNEHASDGEATALDRPEPHPTASTLNAALRPGKLQLVPD